MTVSMAAAHARGKKANDCIFATNQAAQEAAKKYGKDKVVNGTVGAILDETGNIVFLPTVKEEYLHLPDNDYVAYAPIAGLPEFKETCIKACFGDYRPAGFIDAVATCGGTGSVHHLVHNYTQPGDEVLTADWYWGAYTQICEDNHRTLRTYALFREDNTYNLEAFKDAVFDMAQKQENILIIFNTPGNNPTGYTIPEADWDQILAFLKDIVVQGNNKVIIAIDVAYLDYSGESHSVRKFFSKFGNLPAEILTCVCYSLSKGFTMYGQRLGALIGVTSSQDVIDEFKEINAMTSRATWSNCNRPAMRTMVNIYQDPAKFKAYEEEREACYALIQERAAIFMEGAEQVGLPVLPYMGGFFITVPCKDPKAIWKRLQDELVFVIPLKKGIRVAACSIPKAQIKGVPETMYHVMKELGEI